MFTRIFYITLMLVLPAIAWAQQSQNVTLLGNWHDTSITLNLNNQRYNDVWGFVWNNKEYAAIGSTKGVHIIDIDNMQEVAFRGGLSAGPTIIHRDYKTYKNYLYAVCDEGISNLQVFDLSYLPDSLHLVYQTDPGELSNAHNIFIDTAKAKLYFASARGYTTGFDNMRVYSLTNPEHPTQLVNFNLYDKIHDVYVRNDTAYCSASFKGFYIVDFSNTQNFQVIGGMPFYTYQGYNHSSWINSEGIGVMADETHGSPLKVIDVSDPINTNVRSVFSPRFGDTTCVPHNPFMLGPYALISHYMDGLQIYDISNPDVPVRTGYYDTYTDSAYKGFAGAWGCYPYLPSGRILVSDMETGLYVFDIDSAVDRTKLSVKNISTRIASVSVTPNPATNVISVALPYANKADATIRIYDISGREVMKNTFPAASATNQPFELTLPRNMPSGMYILKADAEGKAYTGRFTKL